MEKRTLAFIFIAIISIVLIGCIGQSYGPPQGGNGMVLFTITDKAANMSSVTSINITIDSIQVHSAMKGWVTVSSTPKTYDLLQLKANGIQSLLADVQLENGSYEQVRLEISKIIVTDASGEHEAKLPSGDLKIVGGFEVKANATSVVIFDFVADESLHITGNGEYILAPVVHLQTKENAEVEVNERGEVGIRRGDLKTDVEVGMDENGTVSVGVKIPGDVNISIDGSGHVVIMHGGLPPSLQEACVKSGGRVTTQLCCESASDFPNTCLIGACGCSLDNSKEVKVCDCGEGNCWDSDKLECVSSVNQIQQPEETIQIRGFSFHPQNVEVAVGTKVTWVNNDPADHAVVSDIDEFSTVAFGRGQSKSYTFTIAGTYPYHCAIHPYMRGVVTVK